jgi:hypothetical protein
MDHFTRIGLVIRVRLPIARRRKRERAEGSVKINYLRIRILFELRKREAEGGRDGTRIGTNGRVAFVDLERVPVDLEVVASVGVELLAGLERKREPSKGDKKEMSVVDKVVAFPEVTRPSVRERSRQ